VGIPRLADRHPYASLLISDHAYWLYAVQFEPDPPPEFIHLLQRNRLTYPKELEAEARRFLADVRAMQESFRQRLQADTFWRTALEPQHRNPHARLLQTLDAFSLALCSAVISPLEGEAKGLGGDHVSFHDVPRSNWEDRVSITLNPRGDGRIVVDPYPFGQAPLTVSVPARVVEQNIWWRQAPWVLKRFTFLSPDSG